MSPDMLWPRKGSGTKLEASQRGGNGARHECVRMRGKQDAVAGDLDDSGWGCVDVRDTCDHLPSWQRIGVDVRVQLGLLLNEHGLCERIQVRCIPLLVDVVTFLRRCPEGSLSLLLDTVGERMDVEGGAANGAKRRRPDEWISDGMSCECQDCCHCVVARVCVPLEEVIAS
jgi:hypothetical protein